MAVITGVLSEAYILFERMAPFLVFGYFLSGVLKVFLKPGTVSRHLGGKGVKPVIKASFIGAPLPLCSCGVLPTAFSLKKEGASDGAVLSFLISTPTTGVDSILATYSLLGPFFTFYRIIASVFTGIFSGTIADSLPVKKKGTETPDIESVSCESSGRKVEARSYPRVLYVLKYAFVDLIRDTGPALVAGILAGGAISFLLPDDIVASHLGGGFLPMFIVLAASLPMYICATSSVPVAAALMMKGLSPGAAFVMLVAGPATNIVTMSVVGKNMGKRILSLYLLSIVACSILMGKGLDMLGYVFGGYEGIMHIHHEKAFVPDLLARFAAVFLAVMVIRDLSVRIIKKYGPNSIKGAL